MAMQGERALAEVPVYHMLHRTAVPVMIGAHPVIVLLRSDYDEQITRARRSSTGGDRLAQDLDMQYVPSPPDGTGFVGPVSRWRTQFNSVTRELLIHFPNGYPLFDGDLSPDPGWLEAVAQDALGGLVLITPTGAATDLPALEAAIETGAAVWTRSQWSLSDEEPTGLEELTGVWKAHRTYAFRSVTENDNPHVHEEVITELRALIEQARPALVREYGAKAVLKIVAHGEFGRQILDASQMFDPVWFTRALVGYAGTYPDVPAKQVYEKVWDEVLAPVFGRNNQG